MSQSNLLVIMSNEHQARAMGCAGHAIAQTPHLDALAARGTRFTNAYTASPFCVPARASFATGRYVHQTRHWDSAMPYDGSIEGWGHALQALGVSVESIGKLHYRSAQDAAGFDASHKPMMATGGVGKLWASVRREDERRIGKGRMLGDHIGPGRSTYTEFDGAVVEETKTWLAQERAAPWCLFVGLVAPRSPLIVPPEFFDLYRLGDMPEAKLHPRDGHARHPWVEKQNAIMNAEARFENEEERLRAFAAYFGLCSLLDYNVGEILGALEESGQGADTTVVYTSDHGANLGARGLWGKSNMYEESAAVPLIMAGPGVDVGTCETGVSLLDLSASVADHFGGAIAGAAGVKPLSQVISEPDPERVIFCEYHAAGAVSGAFMIRKGSWKYIHYVGYEDELFHLGKDPEETLNLAGEPGFEGKLEELRAELHAICDPEAVDVQAYEDQAALIERHGGKAAAFGQTPELPRVLQG